MRLPVKQMTEYSPDLKQYKNRQILAAFEEIYLNIRFRAGVE